MRQSSLVMIELDIGSEVRPHLRHLAVVVSVEEGTVRGGDLSEKGIVGGSDRLRLSGAGGGEESECGESEELRVYSFHWVPAGVEMMPGGVTAE